MTEEALNALESAFGYPMPKVYRQFLLAYKPWHIPVGVNLPLKSEELLDLQRELRVVSDESLRPWRVPPNAFSFSCHEGYSFLFFLCEEQASDVQVFLYVEGGEPSVAAPSLAELLEQMLVKIPSKSTTSALQRLRAGTE